MSEPTSSIPACRLSIDAVGAQDEYLDGTDSSFKPVLHQHSPFATYQRTYALEGPYIDSTSKFDFKPQTMGDLLTNAWIKCTIPALPNPGTSSRVVRIGPYLASGNTLSVTPDALAGYEVSNVFIQNSFAAGDGVCNVHIDWDSDYSEINIDMTGTYSNVNWVSSNVETANNFIFCDATNAYTNIYSGNVFSVSADYVGGVETNVFIDVNYTLLKPTYSDQIGRALIKESHIRIGNYRLQTLIDDWYIIRDQLFNTSEQKDGLKNMINGGADFGQLPYTTTGQGPIDLFIPLEMFFCHRDNYTTSSNQRHPYLPLCAIYNQEMELSITFNSLKYFSYIISLFESAGENFYALYPNFDLENVQLILEMVDLSPKERMFYATGKYDIVAPTIFRQPKQYMTLGDVASVNLIPNGTVKMTTWFFRSELLENDENDEYYDQRFNFSTLITSNVSLQSEYSMLDDATLYLEGYQQQNFGVSHLYYKYIQPIESNLSPPELNVYTLSFSLDPLSSQPSGFVDLSITEAGKAVLKFNTSAKPGSSALLTQNRFAINVVHYGDMVLRVDNGQITPLFSLT